MSADDTNSSSNQTGARGRRSSFTGEAFANLFGNGHRSSLSRSSLDGGSSTSQPIPQYPNSIATAAAQAQRRRLSITALGLSGASPNQGSGFPNRRDSYGSLNSGSIDESAIEEESGGGGNAQQQQQQQQMPFGRRLSMGSRALRDVRNSVNSGSLGSNGTSQPTSYGGSISSRDAKGRGSTEGFNWSENFRTRAERASSIGQSMQTGNVASNSAQLPSSYHRTTSTVAMEAPANELPKPREQTRPDHFQERILKGDFYMD